MIWGPFTWFLIAVSLLYFSDLKANNEEFELLSRDAKIFFFSGGRIMSMYKIFD